MIGGLGYRPDPADPRDALATPRLRALPPPPAKVARNPYTKTRDQGQLGSCTCHAAGQAVRAEQVKQLVGAGVPFDEAQATTEFLAFLFAYYLARAVDGSTQVDAGTWLRNVFQILNKFGFPPESAWPYSDDSDARTGRFARMPSSAAFRRAFDQRLAAENTGARVVKYSRIVETGAARVDPIKRALAAQHLVVFGTLVSNGFCSDMSANGGAPIDPPRSDIAGGHAMVWGGYDDAGVDTLNSWSDRFGDGGWLKMSWDYVTWSQTADLWIVEAAPVFSG